MSYGNLIALFVWCGSRVHLPYKRQSSAGDIELKIPPRRKVRVAKSSALMRDWHFAFLPRALPNHGLREFLFSKTRRRLWMEHDAEEFPVGSMF